MRDIGRKRKKKSGSKGTEGGSVSGRGQPRAAALESEEDLREHVSAPAQKVLPDGQGTAPAAGRAGRGRGRKKPRLKRWVRMTLRLCIVLLVLAVVVTLWANWQSLAPSGLADWLTLTLNGGDAGDGYPVSGIAGGDYLAAAAEGGDLVLVSDTMVTVYNAKGGQVYSHSHGFSSPLLRTAGNYILTLDSGGKAWTLQTRVRVLLANTDAPAPLQNGHVDAAGRVTLVMGAAGGYMSQVTVYDVKGQSLYTRQSAELCAVDAALSPDGKRLAVAYATADSGALTATVQVFDTKSAAVTPLYEVPLGGQLPLSMSYDASGELLIVTGTYAAAVRPDTGAATTQPFNGGVLLGYTLEGGTLTAAVRDATALSGGTLYTLTMAGIKALPFDGTYRGLAADTGGVWLLTDARLSRVVNSAVAAQYPTPRDSRLVAAFGNRARVVGFQDITEYGK
ncbi:MAG: DUF5711 family protein [Oscillospiraceae bacterium]|nr:DUF5711 family protein [Oscillospiraceae bacterium]